jgi:5-methyltetrahydropteroyltriglutamate--homocysteine methyltransferase
MASDLRADVVGSLLRPAGLLEARAAKLAGTIEPDEYRRIEDAAVDDALALQERAGLDVVTDGEMRRMFFTGSITDALDGIGFVTGAPTTWHREGSTATETIELPVVVTDRLKRRGSLALEEYLYARERTSKVLKVTIASPLMLSYFWSPEHSTAAYDDPFEMFADAAEIIREQALELVEHGCEYLQIDAPELATIVDPSQARFFADLGIEPDRMLTEGVDLIDHCADVGAAHVAVHMCRGNNQGRWLAEGGYEAISKAVFGRARHVDAFALEYDSPRAGSLEVLRDVPDDKRVVLGLISTKTDRVESFAEIRDRLEEAARHFPREQLALSTQCGFASEDQGNPVTPEHQRAKLELVAEVAHSCLP